MYAYQARRMQDQMDHVYSFPLRRLKSGACIQNGKVTQKLVTCTPKPVHVTNRSPGVGGADIAVVLLDSRLLANRCRLPS